MFIGICVRKAEKPACISAHRLRAAARRHGRALIRVLREASGREPPARPVGPRLGPETQPLVDAAREAARAVAGELGIAPDRPETGYGYLELDGAPNGEAVPLKRFVEKPCAETARQEGEP